MIGARFPTRYQRIPYAQIKFQSRNTLIRTVVNRKPNNLILQNFINRLQIVSKLYDERKQTTTRILCSSHLKNQLQDQCGSQSKQVKPVLSYAAVMLQGVSPSGIMLSQVRPAEQISSSIRARHLSMDLPHVAPETEEVVWALGHFLQQSRQPNA